MKHGAQLWTHAAEKERSWAERRERVAFFLESSRIPQKINITAYSPLICPPPRWHISLVSFLLFTIKMICCHTIPVLSNPGERWDCSYWLLLHRTNNIISKYYSVCNFLKAYTLVESKWSRNWIFRTPLVSDSKQNCPDC